MPETTFESILGTQLRALADGGVRPVDRFAIADAIIATGKPRPWGVGGWWQLPRGTSGSLRTVRLALVLLLALLATALLFTLGPGRRAVVPPVPVPSNGPSPSTQATPTPPPTATPTSGDATDGVADQSIFLRPSGDGLRGMDVVAVNAGGQERLVRRLGRELVKGGGVYRPYGAVGRDGWLSVDVSPTVGALPGTWMLVDLRDPSRPPQFVQYTQVIGGSWSGTGWFATVTPGTHSGFSIDVVDANAGVTQTLGPVRLPGGGPDLIWAADGSGILSTQPNDTYQNSFGIRPRDGSAFRPPVPALADRGGSRWVTQGGRYLDTCVAPDCPTDHVVVHEADGTSVAWYSGELAPARLYDASFSQDGSAIWLLLDRVADGRHEAQVARLDAPGKFDAETGTVDLGPDVSYLWFDGLARDGGSQVAIGYWIGPPNGAAVVDGPVAIVPRTANSHSSLHSGRFVGFMPGSLLDSIPGEGAFDDVPDAPVPTSPPQPPASPEQTAEPGSTAPPEPSVAGG